MPAPRPSPRRSMSRSQSLRRGSASSSSRSVSSRTRGSVYNPSIGTTGAAGGGGDIDATSAVVVDNGETQPESGIMDPLAGAAGGGGGPEGGGVDDNDGDAVQQVILDGDGDGGETWQDEMTPHEQQVQRLQQMQQQEQEQLSGGASGGGGDNGSGSMFSSEMRRRRRYQILIPLFLIAVVIISISVSVKKSKRNNKAGSGKDVDNGVSNVGNGNNNDGNDNDFFALPPPPDGLTEICDSEAIQSAVGRQACEMACEESECCDFPTTLQLSCLEGNEDTCWKYRSACSTLNNNKPTVLQEPNEDLYGNTNPEVAPPKIFLPPAPVTLPDTCATDKIKNKDGFDECLKACSVAKCCIEENVPGCGEGAGPPQDENGENQCDGYAPCLAIENADAVHASIPDEIAATCGGTNLDSDAGRDACKHACSLASCCFGTNETCTVPDSATFCAQYDACKVVMDGKLYDDDDYLVDDDDISDDDANQDGLGDILDDDFEFEDDALGDGDGGAADDDADFEDEWQDDFFDTNSTSGVTSVPDQIAQACHPEKVGSSSSNNRGSYACKHACSKAICCLDDTCGSTHKDPTEFCSNWDKCLILVAGGEQDDNLGLDDDDDFMADDDEGNADNGNAADNTSWSSVPDQIAQSCHSSNLQSQLGRFACREACSLVSCCLNTTCTAPGSVAFCADWDGYCLQIMLEDDENAAGADNVVGPDDDDDDNAGIVLDMTSPGNVSWSSIPGQIEAACHTNNLESRYGPPCKEACSRVSCCLNTTCMIQELRDYCPEWDGYCMEIMTEDDSNNNNNGDDTSSWSSIPAQIEEACHTNNLESRYGTPCKEACSLVSCCLDSTCSLQDARDYCTEWDSYCMEIMTEDQEDNTPNNNNDSNNDNTNEENDNDNGSNNDNDNWGSVPGQISEACSSARLRAGRYACYEACSLVPCCFNSTCTVSDVVSYCTEWDGFCLEIVTEFEAAAADDDEYDDTDDVDPPADFLDDDDAPPAALLDDDEAFMDDDTVNNKDDDILGTPADDNTNNQGGGNNNNNDIADGGTGLSSPGVREDAVNAACANTEESVDELLRCTLACKDGDCCHARNPAANGCVALNRTDVVCSTYAACSVLYMEQPSSPGGGSVRRRKRQARRRRR